MRESDARGDDDDEVALPSLPSGTKNYLTPQGYGRLRAELLGLFEDERPKIVSWAGRTATGPRTATTCTTRRLRSRPRP